MTSIEPYELLALGVVLMALVVFGALYLLRSYRLRRLKELRGEGAGPEVARDRAYNRLALARREADLLSAQGGDASRAQQLIALSSRSLDAREYDRSFELAQAAHETLVQARRLPSHTLTRTSAAASSPPSTAPAASALPGATAAAPAVAAAAPSVPKNRAEAQFQLRLFEEDLVRASSGPKDDPARLEARDLYVQAHAAFGRAEYGEAFRLSLRGRRRIGGSVESLGSAGPSIMGAPRGPAADPVRLAEEVASAERCAKCGYPTVDGDVYCRGCGTALGAEGPLTCPTCGAARAPQDTFCGKCGERYG